MSSSSRMSLRTRTPKKGTERSSSMMEYEDVTTTPIRGGGEGSLSEIAMAYFNNKSTTSSASRPKGRSRRMLEVEPLLGDRPCSREGDCSDMAEEDDLVMDSTTGSNQENEEGRDQKLNESTPKSKSALSRNRNRMLRSSSYTCESAINDKEQRVKCTIRRTPVTSSTTPLKTPESRRYPLRESVKRSISAAIFELSSEEDDDMMNSTREENTPQRPRRLNATYFSKVDFGDYAPEAGELSDSEEDDEEKQSLNGEEEEESSEEEVDEIDEEATPNRRHLVTSNLAKMVLTPEVLNKLEGRTIKRRLALDSPVASGSQTMSPNPEAYFLAENRIKYRKIDKLKEHVMNDAMKGKRLSRRKRLMVPKPDDNLPEMRNSNFSVTTEAVRAQVDVNEFIGGSTHDEEVEGLLKNLKENEFPQWLGLFRDDFNVMLYGYGSKLAVFKEFEKCVNDQYLVVTINGLFPKLNPRKILHGLCEYVNPDERVPHGSNIEAVAREIATFLSTGDHPDIFLVINNFDNLALRMPQMLSVICLLAQVPFIHILASCDTVNAFLGVSQSQALQLRFCWTHCPTFKQYREELKWIPGIYGDETKTVTQKSSLKYVLQSLTGNARKAFALLGQMQLKQMKSHLAKKSRDVYAGVRFQELAKECREKFIAHSDDNLRTLLVEFFDHKLIRQTAKGRHIENMLLIELDIETLEEVISSEFA